MTSTITGLQDPRRTRYRCTDQPPPDLKQVCKAIAKAVRPKRGELVSITKSEIKSRAKSASVTYDEPARQDDLFRFLENCFVIVPTNGGSTEFYYDADQAEAVQRCCRDGSLPSIPSGTIEERIALLRERAQDWRVNADDSCEAAAIGNDDAEPSAPSPAPEADIADSPPAQRRATVTITLFTETEIDAMDLETLKRACAAFEEDMKPLQALSAALKARLNEARRAIEEEARREEEEAKRLRAQADERERAAKAKRDQLAELA